jgi:hypothetical protein
VLNQFAVAVAVSLALLAGGHVRAQAPTGAGRVPVLAELFTSEGCSSCPPADRILEMLATEQPVDGVYVIGLSEHVTYWDHQGWRDPFASRSFTQRQTAYGAHFNLESIFTPQLVIDGTIQMVGSDTSQLQRVLAERARSPKAPLTIEATSGDTGVTVSAAGAGLDAGLAEDAELVWVIAEDNLVVEVKRGENAKRTLRHAGVVRTMVTKKLDASKAAFNTSALLPLAAEWKRDQLRLVAFVQARKTKRVISVAWSRLPAAAAAR